MDQSTKINRLYKIIRQNLECYFNLIGDQPVAVIVSGGIDSSIIAVIAQKISPKIKFFSMVSNNSADLPFVEILAQHLSQKINYVYLPNLAQIVKNDLIKIKNILVKNNLETHLTAVTLAFGFKLLFSNIFQANIRHVFTGQGPDILLAGYHRYKHTDSTQLIHKIKRDLPMLNVDIKRDNAIADLYKIKLHNAYLENNFISACQELDGKDLIQQDQNKFILRQIGEQLGLPKQIVQRPKKAFQYSTGLQKIVLKKLNQ